MAFDLLHHDSDYLRAETVEDRRERLYALIRPGGRIQYSDSLQGTPGDLFASVERMGLEGIVCKRRGSVYASGPSTNWLKVKTFMESELEILGVQRTPGKPTMALMGEIGTRQYVGSAFVTFGRPASDLFKGMVEANLGPPPRDFKRNSKEAVQLMNRILKHRQNPQTAADAPRWRVRAGREVVVEPGMGGRLIAALERKGHKITIERPDVSFAFGGAQIVMRMDEEGYVAGSDGRKDGMAIAL